ncbi:DUF2381 family protein [Melittangium boletus]|uniref:DUF2381 family protein n=1 Tax=Melittangium boletus TaxID=83453 RepID=UPI0012FD683B
MTWVAIYIRACAQRQLHLPSKTPEVCIRPELSLTLCFDAKLARVEVEGREWFRRVKLVDDTLTLVASEALHDGERVPVTVYF